MGRKLPDPAASLRRLKACLDRLSYLDRPAHWAKAALEILDELDFASAATRQLVARELAEYGSDTKEMRARCHVVLGQAAFLDAERRFWKHPLPADSPDLCSCRITGHEPYFAPARAAGAKKPKTKLAAQRQGVSASDYASALEHFERANRLLGSRWQRATPKNLQLAGPHDCDPCMPTFYLGLIALRGGDLTRAQRRFAAVAEADAIRAGQDGALTRLQLRVAAAALEGATALLRGRTADAREALKRAGKLDPQSSAFLNNQGYLYERLGEPEQAIVSYQAALRWDRTDPYAKRRLAAAQAQAGVASAPVIRLKKPSDFHAQFAAIADSLRATLGSKRKRVPMAKAELDRIRLAARRSGGPAAAARSVGLPASVKTLLAYDRHFALWPDQVPLLGAIAGVAGARAASGRIVPSADIDRLVRTDKYGPYAKGFRKLPASVPVWNDDPSLPPCIPLHSPGDQLLFLYVGEADADGEYPIARYDDQPEVWVSEASLIHLVVESAIEAGVAIECAFDFEKLSRKAKKRNARHHEHLSDDPRVWAIVDAD
jgi:tetratricopeptide (TPR) repeat protein